MYAATDFDSQITHDRQQDRLAAAAVHRLVTSSSIRARAASAKADAARAQIPEEGRERPQSASAPSAS